MSTQQDLDSQNADLAELDPEVADRIDQELGRQREGLEMIASENHTAAAVMQAMAVGLMRGRDVLPCGVLALGGVR